MNQQDIVRSPGVSSKANLRLWLRLLKVQRRIEGRLRERLRDEFGSTLPRFDVLAALSSAGKGLRMSELSGILKVSNGNVTGIVDRLVTDGYVKRGPDENDRRATNVCLTKAGEQHFDILAVAHEGWLSDLLARFDTEEKEFLSHTLDRLDADLVMQTEQDQ
jgi:DNA-binding MarR family transcriptional regulator